MENLTKLVQNPGTYVGRTIADEEDAIAVDRLPNYYMFNY